MTTARRVTSGDGFVFLIHHDRSKSNIERSSLPPDRTLLIEDYVPTTWGDASIVILEARALERITHEVPDFRFVVLLSGQDYPIRHLRSLPAVYSETSDGFLDVEPPGFDDLRYELTWFRLPTLLQTPRIERLFERLIYHFNDRQRTVRFASGRLGCTIGVRIPSPIPREWSVYKGSNWWTLSRRAVHAFLEYRRTSPAIYDWFLKRTIIPDEGIFQTFLLNTPGLTFDGPNIRYIRWDNRDSGSPAIMTRADFQTLIDSGRYFARKFDAEIDTEIFDALDIAADDEHD
jgi:hypothetical protein